MGSVNRGTEAHPPISSPGDGQMPQLSSNVALLGLVSMLTAMSSSMIYGLLPVFLARVLGASMTSIGLIEGLAEGSNSLVKILSGTASDWLGRRKPIVVFGYTLSMVVKVLFPLAETPSIVLVGRVLDRIGKGIRDAPRDALVADITASKIRGSGFGLRLSVAFAGFVFGPIVAMALMKISGDNFRLVFWIALIPAFISTVLLLAAVTEPSHESAAARKHFSIRDYRPSELPAPFWWAIVIASLLSFARFSHAFLVLKAHDIGVDAAFVPAILAVIYLVYSLTAYPFGILADYISRPFQLTLGAAVLVCADTVLASATTVWLVTLGAALWGLQWGMTQGLLSAAVADSTPDHLRGTAFGVYDVANGITAFLASAGAGLLWAVGGPAMTFAAGACIAGATALVLMFSMLAHKYG